MASQFGLLAFCTTCLHLLFWQELCGVHTCLGWFGLCSLADSRVLVVVCVGLGLFCLFVFVIHDFLFSGQPGRKKNRKKI